MTFKVYIIHITIYKIIYIYIYKKPNKYQTNTRKYVYITKPSKLMMFRTDGLEVRE